MSSRIRLRRATLANWVSDNPVLDYGEVGLVYHDSNGKLLGFVTGDGTTVYGSLVMSVPPRAGSVETGHEVTWDVIARLDQGNTFATGNNIFSHDVDIKGMVTLDGTDVDGVAETALTVKGKVAVVEDTASVGGPPELFVDGGDIVLDDDGADPPVGGNVILPQSPTDLASEHALKSADTGEGVVKFTEEGVVVANGGAGVGVWHDAGTDRAGPNITVKTDSVVIGGNKFGATSPLVQPPLTYAAAPAASWDALGDLDVPTKTLVHGSGGKSGQIYFAEPDANRAGNPGNWGWSLSTLWTSKKVVIPEWANMYVSFVITGWSSVFNDGYNSYGWFKMFDSSAVDLTPSWTNTQASPDDLYGLLAAGHGGGTHAGPISLHIVTEVAVPSDGKIEIRAKKSGGSNPNVIVTSMLWHATHRSIRCDHVDDVLYT